MYTSNKRISNIINSLSHWVYCFVSTVSEKCSYRLLGVDDELQTDLVCGSGTLKNSKEEKVLGVTIETNPTLQRIL